MDSPGEILRLCRLCLVKDQVNIPIFEEEGDNREIFLKISSCLPVKVSSVGRHFGSLVFHFLKLDFRHSPFSLKYFRCLQI